MSEFFQIDNEITVATTVIYIVKKRLTLKTHKKSPIIYCDTPRKNREIIFINKITVATTVIYIVKKIILC